MTAAIDIKITAGSCELWNRFFIVATGLFFAYGMLAACGTVNINNGRGLGILYLLGRQTLRLEKSFRDARNERDAAWKKATDKFGDSSVNAALSFCGFLS